ncbi:MAG: chorismate synthase [bacterium]
MLTRLHLTTAGESHGPELTGILDGFPAGVPIDSARIDADLARRQIGYGTGGRMAIEQDHARITAGIWNGLSTGGPIAMTIVNRDYANWRDKLIAPMTAPRPGHADLAGAIKYGFPDFRWSLERASARETAMRVALASCCAQLLEQFGIFVGGYVIGLGDVVADLSADASPDEERRRIDLARADELCCPDPVASARMHAAIAATMQAKDTLGGLFQIVALGLPPGLGSYAQWDRRLDGRLAHAVLSIPAMKGVEIGPAFANATRPGTAVQDPIGVDAAGNLTRSTNRSGGLEGGVTTGAPVVLWVAMKPLSTTLNPLPTVDLATGEPTVTTYERSDFCALPRAVPIGEAMVSLVLTDALLEKVGGDSLQEIAPRVAGLRQARVGDLKMGNVAWTMGYGE